MGKEKGKKSLRYGLFKQVNSTHFFMAGGAPGGGSYVADAFLFDGTNQTWTQVQDMATAKRELACVSYQDQVMGHVIIVAGR